MLQPVVIDGIRTPIGKLNGAMKDIQPEEIAAFLLQKICERSHFDIRLLDAVILGQAKQSSDQPNIARLAALMTKFPLEVHRLIQYTDNVVLVCRLSRMRHRRLCAAMLTSF